MTQANPFYRHVLTASVFLLLAVSPGTPDVAGAAEAARSNAAGMKNNGADTTQLVRPYALTEKREPCAETHPTRRPLFGDLHVHTARSQDASTQDTRLTPRDAYRFARGERLGIQPYDEQGRGMRQVQLDRPLDFAAVTDHAEQIGEVHICNTPGVEGHDSLACKLYRNFPRAAFFLFNGRYSLLESRWGFCGDNAEICLSAAGIVWQEHQDAAEEFYDRSAGCEFTSLVAYEWTAAMNAGAHLHRNVIFRNERVPRLPISVMETGSMAIELWRRLDAECRDGAPGCEAITIPHNSNWSDGTLFSSASLRGEAITAEEAPIRARYDRLVEIMQHKGESECALYPGVSDENCAFEKAPNDMAATDGGLQAINFTRDALKRGLSLEGELGTNPLAFGQIGSTDTHLGTPGLVKERGHPGHGGAGKPGNTVFEKPGLPDIATLNPGGLAVVWAEENTRDSIFAAMQRREVYATSGTRPELRFFGGWDYSADLGADLGAESGVDSAPTPAPAPQNDEAGGSDESSTAPAGLCESDSLAAAGYAGGVAMGGALPTRPDSAGAPRFILAASRDPHSNGADLERIEIVKGWVEDGEAKEVVLTVAGGSNGASVDLNTCERQGRGKANLCSVWSDPDFDASQPAFYYARLLENPSCRWTRWACVDAGVRCEEPSTIPTGFEVCCNGEIEDTIQDRAWSSPIWYRP